MSVLLPHIQQDTATRISDTPSDTLAKKQQPDDTRSPDLGSSSKMQSKLIALPYPPRPPTPGPPRPYPPVPPHPPVPSPPPSPRNHSMHNSSLKQLPHEPASVPAPGLHQCPNPNPPPSPGPRRPGPVGPRPNVPTPPPSPRWSLKARTSALDDDDANDPWIALSAAASSGLSILVLIECLSLSTTWSRRGRAGRVSAAAWDHGMTYASSPLSGTGGPDEVMHLASQIATPPVGLLEC